MTLILKRLTQGPILADGALGTALGCPPGLPEEILKNNPEKVLALHQAYIDSGSELIFTNTFGAGRWKERKKLVALAIDLARQAAGPKKFVTGSLGPLADKNQSPAEIQKNYEETLSAFENKPIDLLLLETHYHSTEITAALNAIRPMAPLRPVAFSMTVSREGKLNSGEQAWEMLPRIEKAGVTIVGLNCSFGPIDLYPVFLEMKKRTELPILVKPSAGLPGNILSDSVFAEWISRFVKEGASIVGGCCGTTPDTIRHLAHLVTRGAEK